MEIVPLHRLTWSDVRGEYVEMDSYAFEVRAKDGRVLSIGETRDEALHRASEFILLPNQKTV